MGQFTVDEHRTPASRNVASIRDRNSEGHQQLGGTPMRLSNLMRVSPKGNGNGLTMGPLLPLVSESDEGSSAHASVTATLNEGPLLREGGRVIT